MPTSTFLNLNKDKQNAIIEASLEEFSRVPLKDASINKIIKKANISRGSFYNYFSDINDLYFFAINSYKEKFLKFIDDAFISNNGKLIPSTLFIFDNLFDFCVSLKNRNLIKNIFLNINYNTGIEKEVLKDEVNRDYKLVEIIARIDKTDLNISSEEDLFYIIDIIMGIIIRGLKEVFVDEKLPIIIKDKVERQLHILENGIKKEKK